MKMPKTVEDKIKEYKAAVKTEQDIINRTREDVEKAEAELKRAQDELKAAIDKAILNPSAATTKAEEKAAEAVNEAEKQFALAKDRADRARKLINNRRELAVEALKAAVDYIAKERPAVQAEKLKAIEEAKKAYILALQDYRKSMREFRELYNETAFQTDQKVREIVPFPREKEIAWFYRDHPAADGMKYTITEDDLKGVVQL